MQLLINLIPFLVIGAFVVFALRHKRRFKRIAANVHDVPRHLVPLAQYDVDETGYWARLRLITGFAFGVAMAFSSLIIPGQNELYSPQRRAVIAFAVGAPAFGFLFPATARSNCRRMVAALHAGESQIIDPPPPGRFSAARMICTHCEGPLGFGGVLYLGREGFLFIPHKRNVKPAATVLMEPLESLSITQVPPPALKGLQRLLVPRPQDHIQIGWPGGAARFLVPTPTDTLVKLRRYLEPNSIAHAL